MTVIKVENLGKKYRIGANGASSDGLRHAIHDLFTNPLRKARNGNSNANRQSTIRTPHSEEFWALKDVSFEVKQGEVVGIIGRNGAGKSTLLKILSRITEPTTGRLGIRGRVASLLEVGTGFHPELTGRENVFLNGAILGMTREEIKRKFDEIVAFAEIEKFIDTPVKRYSSGMYVRLAFAVAAHLEPEILIVDEVLAVGDADFQKKCLGKMGEVSNQGRTVLFVSHNMQALRTLCREAIVLKEGRIVIQGNSTDCIASYLNQELQERTVWERDGASEHPVLVFERVSSKLQGEQPNLKLRVTANLRSIHKHKPAHLAVDISDSQGNPVMQALPTEKGFVFFENREHFLEVVIDLPPMVPGTYFVTLWAGSHNTETLDEVNSVVSFTVTASPCANRTFPHTPDHGLIVPHSIVEYHSPSQRL